MVRTSIRIANSLGGTQVCFQIRLRGDALHDSGTDSIVYDVIIADIEGNPLCELHGLEIALHGHQPDIVDARYDVVYRPLEHSESSAFLTCKLLAPSVATSIASTPLDEPGFHRSLSGEGSSLSSSLLSSPGTSTTLLSESTAPSSVSDAPETLVYEYIRGDEMSIQAAILSLDSSASYTLLFIADDGLNGDAVFGFTRALRKEYPLWTIHAAVFDAMWDPTQRAKAAQELLAVCKDEPEVKIDSTGAVFVPRIQLAHPPSSQVSFSPDEPWTLDGLKVTQTERPVASSDHFVVRVTGISATYPGFWEFVGKVDGADTLFTGITTGPIATHVSIHNGSIVEADTDLFIGNDVITGPSALAAAIVATAVGSSTFSHSERTVGLRVLIHDPKIDLGAAILAVCSALGMTASLVTSLSTSQLEPHYLSRPQIVLSASLDPQETRTLRSIAAPRHGRVFLWNHREEGLLGQVDPWGLGDAIRVAMQFLQTHRGALLTYSPPSQLLPTTPGVVPVQTQLFDPKKSYLLIGGIGSLGLHIALWMYEVSTCL